MFVGCQLHIHLNMNMSIVGYPLDLIQVSLHCKGLGSDNVTGLKGLQGQEMRIILLLSFSFNACYVPFLTMKVWFRSCMLYFQLSVDLSATSNNC